MKLIKTSSGWLIVLIFLSYHVNSEAAPHLEGRWSRLLDWPVIAIHSVLTPQGKILSFGTDENGIRSSQILYDVWSPEKGAQANSHNTLTSSLGVDSFCSAAVVMPDNANILMSGGEIRSSGTLNQGVVNSPIFDTQTETLTNATDMSYPRWYPTSVVLPDGNVLVTGGRDNAGNAAITPEVYSPGTNQWKSLFGALTTGNHFWYPKQWVIPDGRVFGIALAKMYYITTSGIGDFQRAGILIDESRGHSATAAMYEPGKIIHIGGHKGISTNGALIIDVNGESPSVRKITRPNQQGRVWANSVILPNGKVLLVGGSEESNELIGVATHPEIWDPSSEMWTTMSPSPTARLYHSTAILLPDGRVLVAGGGAPGPVVNTNAEIFVPPYLFNTSGVAPRPVITNAPKEAPYGSEVYIGYKKGENISRVTLVKTGAVTHSFNMEQRFLELEFTEAINGLKVEIPESANIATPGYYLMFLINDQGTPSKSRIININSTAQVDNYTMPVAIPDELTVTSFNNTVIDVLSNDIGTGLSLLPPNLWSLKGGKVSLSNNKISYTPPSGFNGQDKVWYVLSDWKGNTNSGEVTITITGNSGHEAPTGTPDNISTQINTALTIDVLANDSGHELTLQAPNIWSLKGGNVSLVNNKLIYKPKINLIGEDKIWYVFSDSVGRTNSSVVTIDVIE